MRAHDSPSRPGYICMTRQARDGAPVCQRLPSAHVEPAVADAFLAVLAPAGIAALLALSAALDRERAQVERPWRLRLERARDAAERARRQYDRWAPENRRGARELETRWTTQLRSLAELAEADRRAQHRGLAPLPADAKEVLV